MWLIWLSGCLAVWSVVRGLPIRQPGSTDQTGRQPESRIANSSSDSWTTSIAQGKWRRPARYTHRPTGGLLPDVTWHERVAASDDHMITQHMFRTPQHVLHFLVRRDGCMHCSTILYGMKCLPTSITMVRRSETVYVGRTTSSSGQTVKPTPGDQDGWMDGMDEGWMTNVCRRADGW
jgi:hypothetical protein